MSLSANAVLEKTEKGGGYRPVTWHGDGLVNLPVQKFCTNCQRSKIGKHGHEAVRHDSLDKHGRVHDAIRQEGPGAVAVDIIAVFAECETCSHQSEHTLTAKREKLGIA